MGKPKKASPPEAQPLPTLGDLNRLFEELAQISELSESLRISVEIAKLELRVGLFQNAYRTLCEARREVKSNGS